MKNLKRAGILVLLFVLSASVLFAAGRRDGAVRISVSQTSSDRSPWQMGALAFAEHINSRSGGRFQADVFPNAALSQGNFVIMMEQVQSGALQVAVESLTVLAAYNDRPAIMQMPFTFADEDHVLRFLQLNDPMWEGWMREFERANLVILGTSPRPMRQFNNNVRMIRTPADMEGLVFRTPVNPMFVAIFETLGARPVPAPSSEIYTGIQLGTFHGEDNSIQIQYDFRTFEVARNLSVVNYIADLSFIFMNRDFYMNASPEDRRMFREAGQEFVRAEMAANGEHLQVALAGARRLGVEIYHMPESSRRLFQERLAPFYAEFRRNYTQAEWDAFHDAVRRSAR